jgi:predicted peroxiredoxin
MKKTLSALVVASLLALPTLSSASDKAEKLMTIVTSGDALTQFMGMVLSTQAQKQGAKVEVLFCGQAGHLVTKGAEEVVFKPKGMSANKLLNNLMKNGATVKVCPPYLPNNGKTKADLIDGVSVAKPPKVAERMMDEETKVVNF